MPELKNLKMKKHITSLAVIIAVLSSCFNSYSQNKKQEFSVSVGGPFSSIQSVGSQYTPGNGVNAGLRYSYYLNEGLSLGIGVEYQTYSSDSKFSSISGAYNATDSENESFQFRYRSTDLRETQKLAYINIPIGIQFETPGTTKLYIGAGAKIGFASTASFETTMGNLTTSGYYPQYNVELFNPAFAGYSSTDNLRTSKTDLDTDISYSATIETGIKQLIGKRNSIYVGVYFDHGINSIYDKGTSKNLVEYNAELPVRLKYNSVFDSGLAKDMKLVSYGLKVRFAMR